MADALFDESVQKYNPAAIMKHAHALVRDEHPTLIERVGYRQVFVWKLKRAWEHARTEKVIAEVAARPVDPRVQELKAQIWVLEGAETLRVSNAPQIASLRSKLNQLQEAA